MKSVLISIQPKWCELIASGKKTIEVRKTRPKIDTPFKCYIYCAKTVPILLKRFFVEKDKPIFDVIFKKDVDFYNYPYVWNGKIIGEFMCDGIIPIAITYSNPNNRIAQKEFPYTCLTDKQIIAYLGNGQQGYAWHISDLKIYYKPKELSEFYILCEESFTDKTTAKCKRCQYHRNESEMSLSNAQNCVCDGVKPITHPPQSWCYVEE